MFLCHADTFNVALPFNWPVPESPRTPIGQLEAGSERHNHLAISTGNYHGVTRQLTWAWDLGQNAGFFASSLPRPLALSIPKSGFEIPSPPRNGQRKEGKDLLLLIGGPYLKFDAVLSSMNWFDQGNNIAHKHPERKRNSLLTFHHLLSLVLQD